MSSSWIAGVAVHRPTPIPAATPLSGAGSVHPAPARSSALPVIVLLSVLAVMALGVGIAGAVWLGVSSKQAGERGRNAPSARVKPEVGLATIEQFVNRHDSKGLAHDTAPAWDAATADFQRATQQSEIPLRWPAGEQFSRGRAAYHRGELDKAETALRLAANMDPSWALPHVALAELYGRRKNRDECLAAAQRAQQLEPKLWLGVREAARAYLLRDEFPSAISEFRRALSLAPKNALLLSELALAYHGAHMDEEAIRHAEQALAQDAELVSAHVLLAERHLEAKRGQKALDHASRAVAVQPTNVSGWLAKGDALVLLERRADAKRAYQEALRIQKQTRSQAAPGQRLLLVERALEKGTLPPPRGARATAEAERSKLGPKPTLKTNGDPVAAAVASESSSSVAEGQANEAKSTTRTQAGEVDDPEPP